MEHEHVSTVIPGGSVTITFKSGKVVRGKKLIFSAGSWTNDVLSHVNLTLPLKVISFSKP